MTGMAQSQKSKLAIIDLKASYYYHNKSGME